MANYTSHQTAAFATLLAIAFWGVTVLGGEIELGTMTTTDIAFFGTIIGIMWILVPLYWMRVRWSYAIGIILLVIGLIGAAASPPTSPSRPAWYTFNAPLWDLATVISYIVGLAGIYVSYKSFQETKTASK